MRLARSWQHLLGALRSRRVEVRLRFTEARGAVLAWFRSLRTNDRAQHWFQQVSGQVVATTVSAVLIWMLTRGR